MVNLHFSLLPRWRGAAPVERAILAGDARTGVDLMAVEEGLDTGGTYRRTEVPIGPDDTLEELRARLVDEGTRLLVDGAPRGHRRSRAPRSASRPTPTSSRPTIGASTGAVRPSTSTDGFASATPGPRTGASASRSGGRTCLPSGTAPACAPATVRWSSSRSSPRARAAWMPRRGPTAPAGSPATPSARDAHRPAARARRARPHRARRRLRQPRCSRSCSSARRSRPATGTSPPSSSTARRA